MRVLITAREPRNYISTNIKVLPKPKLYPNPSFTQTQVLPKPKFYPNPKLKYTNLNNFVVLPSTQG